MSAASLPATHWPVPRTTLPALVEQQARHTPRATAVVGDGRTLSYAELNASANRLARNLVARGLGPEHVVAVAIPRSPELIVALLGILKAGASYLPLDPDYPAEHTAYMLQDARPAHGLTAEDVTGCPADLPDTDLTDAERVSPLTPDHPAYVIYTSGTSGTTGRPKGVVITHHAIVNRLCWMQSEYGLLPDDRVLQKSPPSFDPSVCEFFWPLVQGATLVLAKPHGHQDPAYLAALVREERITTVHFAASMLPLFVQEYAVAGDRDPGTLRRVFSGGEGLKIPVVDQFRAALDVPLYSQYGPTEAAVDVTYWLSRPVDGTGVAPIGRPVWNTRIHLLDEQLRPVPEHAIGELYIAGDQLARGYLHQPAATAQRFVADPLGPPGSRMYRTGDLARLREDGELEFVGRVDDQIKIRGHRVEPAEIEAVLATHPAVIQAAVTANESPSGEARLVGYAVVGGYATSAADASPSEAELRAHCAARLPEHLMPAAFVVLDALPLTASGKLDRRALPDPSPDARRVPVGRAPRDAAEEILCGLFADVLGLGPVGVDEDFFALGGHSLTAAKLVGRIRAVLGTDLDVRTVFEAPTVATLAARLAQSGASTRPELVRAERPECPALSPAQRGLWFLDRLQPGSADYNVPVAVRLRGPLDSAALELALADIVRRHESLRTVFPAHNGDPCQQILDPADVTLPLSPTACTEAELDDVFRVIASAPFNLADDAPLRARLLVLGNEDHVLLLVLHHIVTDGWSTGVLLRDLAEAYTARHDGGGAPNWAELPVRYTDFVSWQQDLLGSPADPESRLARGLAHWRAALDGLPDELQLPTDRSRPELSTGSAAVPVALDADLHADLVALARDTRTTLYMVLQAALAALFTRLGAGTDIPLGGVTAGRADERLNDLIGLFVNTLVFRADVSGDPSFRDLLARVREQGLAAYAHQDVPFDRVVEELNPHRSTTRHPLFQTMLVLNGRVPCAEGFAELDGVRVPVETGSAKFDLNFELAEAHGSDAARAEDGVRGLLRYATDLYDEATAIRLVERFIRLLRAASERPDVPLSELDLFAPGERRALIELGVAPGPIVPDDVSVHRIFEDHARRTPDAVALLFEDESVTYAELDARANRLAQHLVRWGRVRRGDIVGIHVPRSPQMVETMLAVLKAGAAYTMLDVDFPAQRIETILAQVHARCLVTATPQHDFAAGVVDLGGAAARINALPAEPPEVMVGADDVACIMFVSGSIGGTKGVIAPHRALVGSLAGQHFSGFGPGEVYLQCAPVSGDAFARQVFGPLLNGGTCVLQPGQRPDPARIAELVARHGVTVLDAAGSLFNHLWDEYPQTFTNLRWVLTCGESASPTHLDALRVGALRGKHHDGGLRIVNGYGPAESTGYTTVFRADRGRPGATSVPIGRPIPSKTVYVLDDRLEPVPPGVPGELYAAGTGLAHGYVDRPGPTAERFVADPFGPPGTRMYRTGDIVRRSADGEIEYLGRSVSVEQVDVRDPRVEPGEIRAVLAGHERVRQVEVLVREDRPGEQRIVAYVVAADGGSGSGSGSGSDSASGAGSSTPDSDSGSGSDSTSDSGSGSGSGPGSSSGHDDLVSDLRMRAATRLPAHLRPSAFVVLPDIPRTADGKLDRRLLPAPEAAALAPADEDDDDRHDRRPVGRAPRTHREEVLCGLFAELLGVERVSIDDDFFALGGHSLLVIRLISRIRGALRVEIPRSTVFAAPTVAAIAARLPLARRARRAVRVR